ncbi:MAG: bacillithiol biosynthesis deacetylase BshB1 [Coriobacteriales bacterium]|nr:bacillithiol biosynthesis deacetylase BshB1 [Coriobacteriales bacterium]
MSERVDLMCIGAHPDDVEIGMGATVAKLARSGTKVAIVDLTDGEPTPYGDARTRAGESAHAAQILGVAVRRTLSMPNRYLFDSREAREELAEVIRELRPKTLFVPYPLDAHPDHVAASSIAEGARFYAKLTKTSMYGTPHFPARVYRYMAVHLRLLHEPTFVHAVGIEDLGAKLDALRAYRSQFGENPANAGVVPMMEQAAAMWGATIGAPAGEPFFAIEPLGVDAIEALV